MTKLTPLNIRSDFLECPSTEAWHSCGFNLFVLDLFLFNQSSPVINEAVPRVSSWLFFVRQCWDRLSYRGLRRWQLFLNHLSVGEERLPGNLHWTEHRVHSSEMCCTLSVCTFMEKDSYCSKMMSSNTSKLFKSCSLYICNKINDDRWNWTTPSSYSCVECYINVQK